MCDRTDARTICGRTLAQTRARLDALLLNQHRNNNNNNRRPRALERAAYKSILCPRTLAAALAFAAAHNLNVDNVAARLASVGPGDLFPQLLAHTELLNPMYGLDAVFWTDMCRLVCTALADAMGCLQRRGVLVRHEHGGEGGQVQVHWAWCAETMALWTAGAGGEERMVEDVDQMVYATTTAAERAAMGLEELTTRIDQLRALLDHVTVHNAATQLQTPGQAAMVAELAALIPLAIAAQTPPPNNNNNHNNRNRHRAGGATATTVTTTTTTSSSTASSTGLGGGGGRRQRRTEIPNANAANQHRQALMMERYRGHVERGAVWLERINQDLRLNAWESELVRMRATIPVPRH